jgi:hypothetical protein
VYIVTGTPPSKIHELEEDLKNLDDDKMLKKKKD